MRCPECGAWNRSSFPKCFQCGTPLSKQARDKTELPAEKIKSRSLDTDNPEIMELYNQIDAMPPEIDPREQLAINMQNLVERKKEGETRKREMQRRSLERGYAPNSTRIQIHNRRNRLTEETLLKEQEDENSEALYSQTSKEDVYYYGKTKKKAYRKPYFGRRRFFSRVAITLVLLAFLYAVFVFVVKPLLLTPKEIPENQKIGVTASIVNDLAAHTITIPAENGTQIYIKEMRKYYIAEDEKVTVHIPDSFWYELEENLTEPTMEAVITPFIRTGTGEQKQMDLIRYTIDIPLSPLTLINPDVSYLEVSTPIYNIKFHVMQNSKVFINGEDFSSYVNTQSGYISYNASIQPIGENVINIVVRSQYYRENSAKIILYREVQDIPLDLSTTLGNQSSSPTMLISATTRAGAQITVVSKHQDLDLSQINTTGAFSFKAVFEKVGMNTIEIKADFNGKKQTTVKFDVYYLEPPGEYTKKAWALGDGFGYQDLLANINARVAKTQIYVFTGPVKEIVSSKPQLAIFDAGDGKGSALPVMCENQTKTDWVLGQRYRIYGDTYGVYGGIPRLIARYTYPPSNQKTKTTKTSTPKTDQKNKK